jgi:hypothetical protein
MLFQVRDDSVQITNAINENRIGVQVPVPVCDKSVMLGLALDSTSCICADCSWSRQKAAFHVVMVRVARMHGAKVVIISCEIITPPLQLANPRCLCVVFRSRAGNL